MVVARGETGALPLAPTAPGAGAILMLVAPATSHDKVAVPPTLSEVASVVNELIVGPGVGTRSSRT